MSVSRKKFKTEVQQLLDIVIHSLYSKKEIFLRELISNASDAIDRLKFESLSDKSLLAGDDAHTIKLTTDRAARTLTISDNGIGMTREEVEKNIGTIASSGTRAFIDQLKSAKSAQAPELIGQFGVGFYSAFMVAEKVTLTTKRAGADQTACKWSSAGDGVFTIEDSEKERHGTDIILHLREDADEFVEEWRLRSIVKQYSDYVAYPVVMDITREEQPRDEDGKPIADAEKIVTVEEETLNSMKAIWKRAKSDVTDDEYKEFYRHVSHNFDDPLKIIHYAAEGATEFRALLFIPSQPSHDLMFRDERRHGLQLYVKNVYITDDCPALLPEYLRFIKGVVDSSDLPLNVSREMLQDDAVIRRINKAVVGRVLKALTELKEKKPEDYLTFYRGFGRVLKEGVSMDFDNREKLQELVQFESSAAEPGEYVSLRQYVDRMPSAQQEIYYICADSRNTAANSPVLEAFRKREFEVLYFIDPIDEFLVQNLTEYDDKKLRAIDKGEVDLEGEEGKEERQKARQEAADKFKDLLEHIQQALKEQIKEVRLSNRLTESASCLVADEHAMSAHMERLFKAMNQDVPQTKRILELNPEHRILSIMQSLLTAARNDKLDDYCWLLYDQALLTEGTQIQDTARFTRVVTDLMVRDGEAQS